jgi:hypothetical protein
MVHLLKLQALAVCGEDGQLDNMEDMATALFFHTGLEDIPFTDTCKTVPSWYPKVTKLLKEQTWEGLEQPDNHKALTCTLKHTKVGTGGTQAHETPVQHYQNGMHHERV